jgi:hypothetical protein
MLTYIVVALFSAIGGFILSALLFLDSGGVATTDDWREQQADQRTRRHRTSWWHRHSHD